MSIPLSNLIRGYIGMIDVIVDYDEPMEVTNTFVWRESIATALDSGELLVPNLREALATADKKLLLVRPTLAKRFPLIFEARNDIPAVYWWWHLDRGIPA